MAKFSVAIRPEAEVEFRAIPFPFRRQLNQLIFKLIADPRPKTCELIEGQLHRISAHGWVILYEVDDGAELITITGFRLALPQR